MREKTVSIKMINGDIWYVPKRYFESFNINNSPIGVMGAFVRGSGQPLIEVYANEDMTGKVTHINPSFIIQVDVEYK